MAVMDTVCLKFILRVLHARQSYRYISDRIFLLTHLEGVIIKVVFK
jgi:hypothetical protein